MVLRGERVSNDPDLLDNLQVWTEYGYNTRLLHSNLAFPLLKKLTEINDLNAKKIFKEEIGKRFEKGPSSVQQYLAMEGYLNFLTREELWSIIPQTETDILQDIEKIIRAEFNFYPELIENKINQIAFLFKDNSVKSVSFYNCLISIEEWEVVIEKLSELHSLEYLVIRSYGFKELPDNLGRLSNLIRLGIRDGALTAIPESVGNLASLNYLDLSINKLEKISQSIGKLKSLKNLNLRNNQLESIPTSIGNFDSLLRLDLNINKLTALPDIIGDLKSLKVLIISNNKGILIPKSIANITCLEDLYLSNNKLEKIPSIVLKIKSLKYLHLDFNEIKEVPASICDLENLDYISIKNNLYDLENHPESLEVIEKFRKNGKRILLYYNPKG